MYNMKMIRKELKDKFIQELTPSERFFFLRIAREAIAQKGYPAVEDLFHYCYFLTLKERLRGISTQGGEGYMRFLLVEGMKDIEDAIKLYEEKLEIKKLSGPDPAGHELLEYLSE